MPDDSSLCLPSPRGEEEPAAVEIAPVHDENNDAPYGPRDESPLPDVEEPLDVFEAIEPMVSPPVTDPMDCCYGFQNGTSFDMFSLEGSVRSGSDEWTFRGGKSDTNFDMTHTETQLFPPTSSRKFSMRSVTDHMDFTYESKGTAAKTPNGYSFTMRLLNPTLAPVPSGQPISVLSENSCVEPKCDSKQTIKPLTKAERAVKLKRYIEKRKKRKWKLKPEYIGRQKVAESRLRVNGKFVGKEWIMTHLLKGSDGNAAKKLVAVPALPEVKDPVFGLVKANSKERLACHSKYHNKPTKTLLA